MWIFQSRGDYHVVMNLKLISTAKRWLVRIPRGDVLIIFDSTPSGFPQVPMIRRQLRLSRFSSNPHFLLREPSPLSFPFFILPGQSSSSSTGILRCTSRFLPLTKLDVPESGWRSVFPGFIILFPSSLSSPPRQLWTPFPVILYLLAKATADQDGKGLSGQRDKKEMSWRFLFSHENPKLARDINPWLNTRAICCS